MPPQTMVPFGSKWMRARVWRLVLKKKPKKVFTGPFGGRIGENEKIGKM